MFDIVDYADTTSADRLSAGLRTTALSSVRRAAMPAYMHHHEVDMAAVVCPGCIGLLPMFVRDVEPHWSLAKIDFIYECSECGAEVRHTMRKPPSRH
jgi:hypothetical protein